jgi:uncharacterized coiled-coil protein SlyX
MKNDTRPISIVLVLLTICIFLLSNSIIDLNKTIKKQQEQIDAMNIQIGSLWENVLQLQEEYGKIIDKLYNPEYNNLGDN